jgi:peroxiredoxin Q/BCP
MVPKVTKKTPKSTAKPAAKSVAKAPKAAASGAPKKNATSTTKTSTKAVVKAAPKAASKATAKKSSSAPAVGDKAPGFRLPDDAGHTVSLADFSGRTLIVYFYPKDDTPGCTQESCDFRDNLGRLSSAGAAVVGVSADTVEKHRKFKAKHGLNFPLLSDPDHAMLDAYGVWQEKSLYGRKFMGIVRSTFVIDGAGVVRAAYPKVSVTGHVDEVLAAVKALKGAKA